MFVSKGKIEFSEMRRGLRPRAMLSDNTTKIQAPQVNFGGARNYHGPLTVKPQGQRSDRTSVRQAAKKPKPVSILRLKSFNPGPSSSHSPAAASESGIIDLESRGELPPVHIFCDSHRSRPFGIAPFEPCC